LNERGEKNGRGTCTYIDGSVYTGYYVNGLRHGYGEMKYSNGCKFKG
jgi:hypothetical protein